MSFPILAMPRASLVARGCSFHRDSSHRDAYRIAAVFSSCTDDAAAEAPGAHPSQIVYRVPASTKKE